MNVRLVRCVGALAALLATSTTANAATWQLISVNLETANGASSGALSGDLLWTDDGNANVFANDQFTVAFDINPIQGNELFDWVFDDMAIFNDNSVTATSFSCVEGPFGATVGANLCGNYGWGPNFIDDGGTGDDVIVGPAQSIADFNPLLFGGWNGSTNVLTMTNVVEGVSGSEWQFQLVPVPVPAAAWLFGSALGLLGWMRRNHN